MPAKRQRLAGRPEVILDAANAVLRRGGRSLTIDAVAAAAGLSKGGVLHHFASKDALILALVTRKLATLRDGIAACEADLPPGPDRLLLANVEHVRRTYSDDDECSRALLLAAIDNPEALAGYRAFFADQFARLGGQDQEQGGGDGAVLLFAIVGLIMGRTLGFHELDTARLAPMFEAMERTARGSGSKEGGSGTSP